MEGFLGFVYFIMLVWGILNIILFFKIWSMTNDVKELKDYFMKKDNGGNDAVKTTTKIVENPVDSSDIKEGSIVYCKKDGKKMKVVKVLPNGMLRLDDGTDKPQYDEMSINDVKL